MCEIKFFIYMCCKSYLTKGQNDIKMNNQFKLFNLILFQSFISIYLMLIITMGERILNTSYLQITEK